LNIVDLGCGTGLSGAALRPLAGSLVGVDISEKMIAKASERGVYDQLVHGEVVDFLSTAPDRWDLITAADVLVYMGDLNPLFAAARAAQAGAGLFALSVEAHDGSGYVIRPSRRFAHSLGYLRGCAARHGFAERCAVSVTVRSERGRSVDGFLMVLERA
jgi:predicted TPR repeat methyltransferase